MSIEHSAKLIKEIADRKEADEYFEGLLKDSEMRADTERAETTNKWDELTQESGVLPPSSEIPDREMEL